MMIVPLGLDSQIAVKEQSNMKKEEIHEITERILVIIFDQK